MLVKPLYLSFYVYLSCKTIGECRTMTEVAASLIRTNLGPGQVYHDHLEEAKKLPSFNRKKANRTDRTSDVFCLHERDRHHLACEVRVTWESRCGACATLQGTFTAENVALAANMEVGNVTWVSLDCASSEVGEDLGEWAAADCVP